MDTDNDYLSPRQYNREMHYETSTSNEMMPDDIGRVTAACGEAIHDISLDARDLQSENHLPDKSWIVVTGENTPDFNMAMVGNSSDAAETMKGVISILKDYKLPAVVFTPANNEQLKEIAASEGLANAGTAPLMELNIKDAILNIKTENRKLMVEPVVNTNQLRVATHIQSEALGYESGVINRTLGEKVLENPNVKTFIGYDRGDDPVATIMIVEHGNIATIWNVGTIPEKQSHGYGAEIMKETLRWYTDRGIEKFYLLSSEAGKKLYDKLGFQTIQNLDTWVVNDTE